jgi:hypothetical protein
MNTNLIANILSRAHVHLTTNADYLCNYYTYMISIKKIIDQFSFVKFQPLLQNVGAIH